MGKRFLLVLFALFCLSVVLPQSAYAIEDPLAVPNNKFGISILFDSELSDAANLIDTSGGDWGYVTIPIQATDRDLGKWQHFMDQCKILHLIPIIRVATDGSSTGFNTQVWRKPAAADLVSFASFLNSLSWPTQNRYVIIFNEVNRFDEWGGSVDPSAYANLLSYAVSIFKSKNRDFFIISAGLDNAAPSQGSTYMNEYDFMRAMDQSVPGIFNQIDGLASHSYPNPAFAQPPNTNSRMGVGSYSYERALAESLGTKKLPVFITETGWSSDKVSADTQANYYQQAFTTAWADPGIVAITPFLLNARAGAFEQFSFVDGSGTETKQYAMFKTLPKVKGSPILEPTPTFTPMPTPTLVPKKRLGRVLGAETSNVKEFSVVGFFLDTFKFLWGK